MKYFISLLANIPGHISTFRGRALLRSPAVAAAAAAEGPVEKWRAGN